VVFLSFRPLEHESGAWKHSSPATGTPVQYITACRLKRTSCRAQLTSFDRGKRLLSISSHYAKVSVELNEFEHHHPTK